MAAAGYAEYHPVDNNATEDGRAKNRRVDIILLSHPVSSQ
jgi:chemotaxis protein MotB